MSSVWYIGGASARIIGAADWAEAGFAGRPASVWDGGNGYSLPQTAFLAGQLTRLDLDDGFVLTDVDGPRPGSVPGPSVEVVTRGWVEERIYEDRQALVADFDGTYAAKAIEAEVAGKLDADALDDATATVLNDAGSQTVTKLTATYVGLVQAAKNPDLLVAGAVMLDGSDQITSAAVLWPDGSPGTLTITARHATGAVTNYNITYGSPVTKTFTQPTITRNANGAATNVPQIVVS